MSRVAVYGGAFDPPHLGHAFAVTWLLSRVDEVWLMPTARHAFGKAMSPWEARAGLLETTLAGFDRTRVRVIDIERRLAEAAEGPTYTWDVLSALQVEHPERAFSLVVGSDNLAVAGRWHNFDALVERWPLIVLDRPGHEAALRRFIHARPCEVSPPLPDVSSSQVRSAIRGGAAEALHWVDPRVVEAARGLYGCADSSSASAPSVFVLGAGGRAGRSLCAAFETRGVRVVGRWSGRSAPWPTDLRGAEVILLCVPDSQIGTICETIGRLSVWDPGASVVHCAGRWGLEPLQALAGRASLGAWHPLQSLNAPERAASVLMGSMCAVSGDEAAVDRVVRLTRALGASPRRIAEGDRPLWHTAAVVAGNLPVVLLGAAVQLLESIGLDEPASRAALLNLLRGALTQAEVAPAAQALTGPLARGDLATIEAHLTALEARWPHVVPAYVEVNRLGAALLEWPEERRTALEDALTRGGGRS